MAQMVNAIEHLQNLDIVHRDLKPLNVMLDENWNTKLIDFGDAKCLSQPESDGEETESVHTDEEEKQ